jgi:uncharacterized protein
MPEKSFFIDRIRPTIRPDEAAVARQEWRDLLFTHWPLPPAIVQPLLPKGLTLDTHNLNAWVSVVPLIMGKLRPAGIPRALGLTFSEVNVRTYVHKDGVPGVYFFSLDASSRLAVTAARLVLGMPFHRARIHKETHTGFVEYTARRAGDRAASFEVHAIPGELLPPSRPGLLTHFLLERYITFFERHGRLYQQANHHRTLPARAARAVVTDLGVLRQEGIVGPLSERPLAHFVDRIEVEL